MARKKFLSCQSRISEASASLLSVLAVFSTPMSEEHQLQRRRWNRAHTNYTCADGTRVACRFETVVLHRIVKPEPQMNQAQMLEGPFRRCRVVSIRLLRNGLLQRQGRFPLLAIGQICMSRNARKVFIGSHGKTYSFPQTAVTVNEGAFMDRDTLQSVRLNDGLRVLGDSCFMRTSIRRLVLPPSIRKICPSTFADCVNLQHADLRAARGLKCLETSAFQGCKSLRRVLLGDGLKSVRSCAFKDSGLESFTAPASLCGIGCSAFANCKELRHVDLGTCALRPEDSNGLFSEQVFDGSGLESIVFPRTLRVIGDGTFAECEKLRSVSLGENPTLEEIGSRAFANCALESFAVPSSLRKIGDLVFCKCSALRDIRLNAEIQELGFLCFWGTGVTDLEIPALVRKTPEQLGVGPAGSKVLHLPDAAEMATCGYFRGSDVEKVIVPSGVKVLGEKLLYHCRRLREVVFGPGSHLESIESSFFYGCGFTEIVIPGSVQTIGCSAFQNCRKLRKVIFESGSRLERIGDGCFAGCGLEEIVLPECVKDIGQHTF